jgi:outer membrane receptor for ferrienterochelin and colicin
MPSHLYRSSAIFVFASLFAVAPAKATADSNEEVTSAESDMIIVTATRSGTELENLPLSASVVDEEELQTQLRQNRSILNALEFTVPGLSIQAPEDRSSCGSQIRGRNASFQINGVPVNEDLRAGSCTAPFALTPFAVERVEVVSVVRTFGHLEEPAIFGLTAAREV